EERMLIAIVHSGLLLSRGGLVVTFHRGGLERSTSTPQVQIRLNRRDADILGPPFLCSSPFHVSWQLPSSCLFCCCARDAIHASVRRLPSPGALRSSGSDACCFKRPGRTRRPCA